MEITRIARAEQFELKLKGRMDAMWSDHVANALAECVRGGQHIIAVDMAEVDYISSAGIRILVIYSRQLKNIQGRFTVINASVTVRKVLELAGLGGLLHAAGGPVAKSAATTATEPCARKIPFPQEGAVANVFDLQEGAVLRVQGLGNPAPWLEGRTSSEAHTPVEFSAGVMGLGLGAFSSGDAKDDGHLGEFLAAAGAAVCQPADGSNKPDYMLLQGALTPTVKVAYGMVGRGTFSHLVRFDKGAPHASLPLSAVVKTCLEAVGSDAVGMVLVAETAALVGASLQKTPSSGAPDAKDIFAFPGIRDWLSFTAEAAFANSTCLIVGFAAAKARGAGFPLLKPLVPSGEVLGHFHAAAFPYRPLRKGRVELNEAVQPLFETENILGLLHLVNDWRDASGAGESRFLRGACWCAPLAT